MATGQGSGYRGWRRCSIIQLAAASIIASSAMKVVGMAGTVCRMVKAYGACATQLLASTACTVKFDVPPAVGVPDSRPAADSVIPGGSVPLKRLNVNGAVPPATVSC